MDRRRLFEHMVFQELSWIKMYCIHCGASGELPERNGKPDIRLCWNCSTTLRFEHINWERHTKP